MSPFFDRHPFFGGLAQLVRRYFDHRVARDSAALTYSLLFALFPLLIFLSNLLGLLQIDVESVVRRLGGIMPQDALRLIEDYLVYVSRNSSRTLLWFSLVFSVYSPFCAANTLFACVRKAYGLERAGTLSPRYQLRVLLYTLFLILAIVFSFALSTIGSRVLEFLSHYLYVSDAFVRLWSSLRFVLLGAIVFSVIALLYALALDGQRELRVIWPGVLLSLAAWLLLSMGFSYYVEHAARYSLIYGSIGAIIVLLIWLYLTASTLIMGAECNAVLLETRKKGQVRPS